MKTIIINTRRNLFSLLASYNKSILLILIAILFSSNLISQNQIDNILKEIEANNTSLLAIRKSIDAEKIGNKTGIYLSNPEFEMGYLWGEPSVLGNRTDLSLTQSFQFPTAYKYKKKISGAKNEQLEIEYLDRLKSVMLQSKLICVELTYVNAMIINYEQRNNDAKVIADSYQIKFDQGEANVIEYNKAQINYLNQTNKIQSLYLKKNSLFSDLQTLNGGKDIIFTESSFSPINLGTDFKLWYSEIENNIPTINWYNKEYEKEQSNLKLTKASNLPEFHAGYMSEKVTDQKFQGVAFGISIPLWENKNSIKHSKANLLAVEGHKVDIELANYSKFKSLFENAKTIETNLNNYKLGFSNFDNSDYLKKAFDSGEISLIEYMLELSLYYESLDNILELERELHLTLAELNKYK